MSLPVLILNGPNLNMLGKREPAVYGTATLADIETRLRAQGEKMGLNLEFFQSNDEGALVSRVQQAMGTSSGVIVNAGAYTHTSIALLDALSMLAVPVIEVHLSNVYRRESFRHKSYISMVAQGVICGFGAESYILALSAIRPLLQK